MKKINLLFLCAALTSTTKAQVVIDTVSTGASYANQVWYSLENDEQGSSPKNSWELAFETSNQGGSIHINSSTSIELWLHPTATVNDFATIDTTGLSTWTKLYNSNTDWSTGAFNQPADTSDDFDMGWGTYSMITHSVVGDRVFIVKLGSSGYKKMYIESLAGGAYTFKHANLDNSSEITNSITKSAYNTKNFVYYNLQTNQIVDREPVSNDWDITFTQNIEFIPSAYLVTTVLHNKKAQSVKVYPVNDPTTYADWQSQTLSPEINKIGYDWKSFNMVTYQWEIADSTVYFVQDNDSSIWKVIFTGFGGGSTGNYIFSKELLHTVGINEVKTNILLDVYPNPTSDFVVVTFQANELNTTMNLIDLTGKKVFSKNTSNLSGLVQEKINISEIPSGIYLVTINSGNSIRTQKLIIQ